MREISIFSFKSPTDLTLWVITGRMDVLRSWIHRYLLSSPGCHNQPHRDRVGPHALMYDGGRITGTGPYTLRAWKQCFGILVHQGTELCPACLYGHFIVSEELAKFLGVLGREGTRCSGCLCRTIIPFATTCCRGPQYPTGLGEEVQQQQCL